MTLSPIFQTTGVGTATINASTTSKAGFYMVTIELKPYTEYIGTTSLQFDVVLYNHGCAKGKIVLPSPFPTGKYVIHPATQATTITAS